MRDEVAYKNGCPECGNDMYYGEKEEAVQWIYCKVCGFDAIN